MFSSCHEGARLARLVGAGYNGAGREGLETKFVYVATKGADDPTLASIPLHLAVNGSVEAGHDAAVILVGDGAEIAIEGTAQSLEGVGVPPMAELLDKLREHEVPVYV